MGGAFHSGGEVLAGDLPGTSWFFRARIPCRPGSNGVAAFTPGLAGPGHPEETECIPWMPVRTRGYVKPAFPVFP